MIANYLSRQLRTIIRHAVRGSGCAAFRDIARVRKKFSLGVYVHTRVYARACVLRCPWRALPAEGGERNRCTRQRDADRRCSFSFFLASPSSSAFRSASPIPLPPFPLHSPRKACLLAVSLSLLPSHSSPLSLPSLSVYPEIARSHHGIIRCEVVQRPLSRLDLLAGFISKRDDAW